MRTTDRGVFGEKLAVGVGIVSRETSYRVSVRANGGWERGAAEKRQRPTFPCVGELSRLGKTFHVKRRVLGCHSQPPRARTRHLAWNARLFESISRETNKALPESFIKSGEFYKKRSVAAIFAQTGLSCRLACADFLMLLCGTGSFEKQRQGNGVSRETFARHGDIATQETAETIGGGFCVETPCFPGCARSGRFFESANRTAGKKKKTPKRRERAPLQQKQRPRPVCLTDNDRADDAVPELLSRQNGFPRSILLEVARKHRVCPYELSPGYVADVSHF